MRSLPSGGEGELLIVVACLFLCLSTDCYVMFCVKICSGCGFNYTAIYRKTKRATTLIFVMQLRYI